MHGLPSDVQEEPGPVRPSEPGRDAGGNEGHPASLHAGAAAQEDLLTPPCLDWPDPVQPTRKRSFDPPDVRHEIAKRCRVVSSRDSRRAECANPLEEAVHLKNLGLPGGLEPPVEGGQASIRPLFADSASENAPSVCVVSPSRWSWQAGVVAFLPLGFPGFPNGHGEPG